MRKQEALIFNPDLAARLGFKESQYATELSVTVKKLIAIWQKYIPCEKRIRLASQARNKILLSVFVKYFKGNFVRWKSFVVYITKSNFLMRKRKRFKLCFEWVIQEENLCNILRGKYHPQERIRLRKSLECLERNTTLNQGWKKTLQDIASQMGIDAYRGFSSKVEFVGEKNGTLALKVEPEFRDLYTGSCYYRRRFPEIAGKHFEGLRKINMVSGETERVRTIN